MKWQDLAKILGPTAGIIFVLAGLLNLSGMSYSVPPDIVCEECYSLVEVNSSYWEIRVEHAGDKDILFKKMSRSRTLWLNLDKVNEFIPTNPEVKVEILVPTIKSYGAINHPEFGWLRPLKDGDTLIARKNKYNPNGDRFVVHGLTKGKTVKWGLDIQSYLSGDIVFDPIWKGIEREDCKYIYENLSRRVPIYESQITEIKKITYANLTFRPAYNQTTQNFIGYETQYYNGKLIGVKCLGKTYNGIVNVDIDTVSTWTVPIGDRNFEEYGRCREYEIKKGVCSMVKYK